MAFLFWKEFAESLARGRKGPFKRGPPVAPLAFGGAKLSCHPSGLQWAVFGCVKLSLSCRTGPAGRRVGESARQARVSSKATRPRF